MNQEKDDKVEFITSLGCVGAILLVVLVFAMVKYYLLGLVFGWGFK